MQLCKKRVVKFCLEKLRCFVQVVAQEVGGGRQSATAKVGFCICIFIGSADALLM